MTTLEQGKLIYCSLHVVGILVIWVLKHHINMSKKKLTDTYLYTQTP